MNTLSRFSSPLQMAQTGLVTALMSAQVRLATLPDVNPNRAATLALAHQAYGLLTQIGTGRANAADFKSLNTGPLTSQQIISEEASSPSLANAFVLGNYKQIAQVIQALRTGEGVEAATIAMTQGALGIDASISAEESFGHAAHQMFFSACSTNPDYDSRLLLAQIRLAQAMGRMDLNPLNTLPLFDLNLFFTKSSGQHPPISSGVPMGRDPVLRRSGLILGHPENPKFFDLSSNLLNVTASGQFQD